MSGDRYLFDPLEALKEKMQATAQNYRVAADALDGREAEAERVTAASREDIGFWVLREMQRTIREVHAQDNQTVQWALDDLKTLVRWEHDGRTK